MDNGHKYKKTTALASLYSKKSLQIIFLNSIIIYPWIFFLPIDRYLAYFKERGLTKDGDFSSNALNLIYVIAIRVSLELKKMSDYGHISEYAQSF